MLTPAPGTYKQSSAFEKSNDEKKLKGSKFPHEKREDTLIIKSSIKTPAPGVYKTQSNF